MKLQFHGFRSAAGSPVREALTAVRHQEAAGNPRPVLVAYTPVARVNPYQSLLYSQLRGRGIAVAPVTDPWSFPELMQLETQTSAIILHIHWPAFVLRDAETEAGAERLISELRDRLVEFADRGGRLIWTVHNLVTHDARFVEQELRLQQLISDLAWRIHIMDESTESLTEGFVDLDPSKTFVVPHPSYRGAYEDYITREEARETLDIDPDEVVYAIFGAIMAYKGIEDFLDGFDAVYETSAVRRRLIVAGAPDGSPETERLLDRLRNHPAVLLDDRKVPGDRVQFLLRAADIMVVPHSRALNSGAALLGPTFDLPLLARRVGVLPSLLDADFTEFFDDAEHVPSALAAADRLLQPEARDAARRFSERHAAGIVSGDFAEFLKRELAVPAGMESHDNA